MLGRGGRDANSYHSFYQRTTPHNSFGADFQRGLPSGKEVHMQQVQVLPDLFKRVLQSFSHSLARYLLPSISVKYK